MPEYTLHQLSERVGAQLVGDGDQVVHSIASIDKANKGSLTYLKSDQYLDRLMDTKACAVILSTEHAPQCPVSALIVDNPEYCFAQLASLFSYSNSMCCPGIAESAIVNSTASIADSASIGAHCVIGANAVIGEGVMVGSGSVIGDRCRVGANSQLHANVTLYHDVRLGERVEVDSGVVIGADGFGLVEYQGQWKKIPQLGGVCIGDDVGIGANTTVDRGAIEDTVIGSGVRIDNQVQIGHNVSIGDHTVIAGCVGIAGSTHIGKHCVIAGAVGIVGHIKIVDRVVITAMSGVSKSISEPGVYSSGNPLQENKHWRRSIVRIRQLESWVQRIMRLEKGEGG